MTLYKALQDINKGRFIDNGYNLQLVAIAKGRYIFHLLSGDKFEIELLNKQGENARQIENEFYIFIHINNILYSDIISADYKKPTRASKRKEPKP